MPSYGGGLGLFTINTGETLPKGGVSFSAGVNKFGRAPGSLTVLETGFNVGVGLTDWLSAYMQFDPDRHVHVGEPGQLSLNTPTTGAYQQYDNSPFRSVLPIPGARPGYAEDVPFASQNGGGVGDVALGLTFGLLSEDRGKPITLSFDNQFFIPTHTNIQDLLNDETQSGQFDYQLGFNASKRFFNNNFQFVAGWDYRFTRDATFHGFDVFTGNPKTVTLVRADQMQLDGGYVIFPNKRFQIMNEYTGLIFLGSSTPDTTFGARDPVDGIWGVRVYPTRWLAFDVGYRYMLNLSQLNDRNGFVIKVGSVYWPEKVKAPDTVGAVCSVDPSSVMADSNATVHAMVQGSDTYNHTLNYSWMASGGKIEGSGPDVRWDSTGVVPGTYTVTAHVDDGRGNVASCSSDITVEAKPIPAPTMTCSADHSSVIVGERATITADVHDESNTPLTYKWQANGGQIVGEGSSVQLDTTGLAPGNYAVTGRVENGKGGAADCSTNVNVQGAPPAPVSSKINQCIFRTGSARVDNVCKRILDDVAIRLQNDPQAKVIFVGYADPKEARSAKLAQQRAENAIKYVAKKNVAESRMEARSASGQAGAGKQNQRIDVIYVPEGASY